MLPCECVSMCCVCVCEVTYSPVTFSLIPGQHLKFSLIVDAHLVWEVSLCLCVYFYFFAWIWTSHWKWTYRTHSSQEYLFFYPSWLSTHISLLVSLWWLSAFGEYPVYVVFVGEFIAMWKKTSFFFLLCSS